MKQPLAEIVCLGNELLMGITVNTNATYIGEQLTKLGYEVRRITCIRDDIWLAVDFFKEIFERKNDIIIVTGGLGPTHDDIQLEVLSKATNLELDENTEALEQVEQYYKNKGLKLKHAKSYKYQTSSSGSTGYSMPISSNRRTIHL